MLEAVQNAFRVADLRRKLLFTFGILVIYRFAAHVPVPGVDREALRNLFNNNELLGFLNILTGGALQNFSVLAMGVYPFITASIILQLVTPLIKSFGAIKTVEARGQENGADLFRVLEAELPAP